MKKDKTKYILIALLSLGAIVFSFYYELTDSVLVTMRSFSAALFVCSLVVLFTKKEKTGMMLLFGCMGCLVIVLLNLEFNCEALLKAISILVAGGLIYLITRMDRDKTE
jgi:FtsH-binding integral membrane protein